MNLRKGIAAVSLVAGVVAGVPGIAQAETPPKAYDNGTELAVGVEKPIVAWGRIFLRTTTVESPITCINTFYAKGGNKHEGGVESNPIRAYGEVLGWGTNSCTAEGLESLLHSKVQVSAEEPPEKVEREGEICKEASKTKLSECPSESEREKKTVTVEFRRRFTSLPWKVEYIRGKTAENVEVVQQRTGLHELGEAGNGREESTKCYPSGKKFTEVPSGCIVVNIEFPTAKVELLFFGTQEISGFNGAGSGLKPSFIVFEKEHTGYLESEGEAFGKGVTTGEVKLLGAEGQELMTAK